MSMGYAYRDPQEEQQLRQWQIIEFFGKSSDAIVTLILPQLHEP